VRGVLRRCAGTFGNHEDASDGRHGHRDSADEGATLVFASTTWEDTTGRFTLGKVTAGQTDGKADHSLVAEVTGAMTPGAYTVRWKTSGKDGHMLTGSFGYTFTPKR
jgi:methionine-rich copper-binding protein CopC